MHFSASKDFRLFWAAGGRAGAYRGEVGDLMTRKVISVTPETTVQEALSIMVDRRITGMPVVDPASGSLLGIVSDSDLLALEVRGGQLDQGNIFPSPEQSWETFNVLQDVIEKSRGTRVEEVMTEDPVTVRESSNLADAVVLLLQRRIRRLPVVDEAGRVVGLLSRADVIRSTLAEMKSR